jgi:hypothetical protein
MFGLRVGQNLIEMQNYPTTLLCQFVLPRIGLPVGGAYPSQFASFLNPNFYFFLRHHNFRLLIHASPQPYHDRPVCGEPPATPLLE